MHDLGSRLQFFLNYHMTPSITKDSEKLETYSPKKIWFVKQILLVN